MSWKRTVLAFAILVLMLLALLLDSRIIATRKYRAVRDASVADSVNISQVDQIFLRNAQGSVKLVRTSVGWRMKEPVDAPADTEVVETVLTNVTSARRRNEIEAKNLAQYGLASPEIELTLVSDQGKFGDWGTSFGLQLGYESTYTGQVFARYPAGENVFTVGEHVRSSLLRSPLDFRMSRLVEIDTSDLNKYTGFELASPGGEGVTLSNNNGTWAIAAPASAPAEQNIVREYFDRLGVLRAMGYVNQNSDRPTSLTAAMEALSSPSLVLRLNGVTGVRPQQLNVALAEGPGGPVYVAQRAGEAEVMVLSSETVGEIRRTAQYFRSRELFTMQPEQVGLFTIQIARAAPTALVRNEKGEWELVGDPEFRINQGAVNERLGALTTLRVEDYVDPNPVDLGNYGLDNPRIRFNMTSVDKTKTESMEVGALQAEGGTVSYARSTADKGIFTVRLSREMLILPAQIADRNFAAVDLSRLVRTEIEVDGNTYELTREGDEWKLLKPGQSAPQTVDLREAQAFLTMINTLEYDTDVTASSQVVVAPDKGPDVKVRFYGDNDAPLNELNVTARINRSTSLVTNGRDRTFEVSTQAIERIYAAAKNLVR
jgi:hypothetical protein